MSAELNYVIVAKTTKILTRIVIISPEYLRKLRQTKMRLDSFLHQKTLLICYSVLSESLFLGETNMTFKLSLSPKRKPIKMYININVCFPK